MTKERKKVVVITGASSGIGKALAEVYARKGFRVVLAARSRTKLDAMVAAFEEQGLEALAVTTDVQQEKDCKALIDQTIKTYGQIDVLINNAGISMRALFEDVDLEVIHRLMNVNFWGAVYTTKYALPYLLERRGSVVGVSSIAGFKGLPGRTGYSASKFALQGFLEVLRIENLKKGLHVLIAAPGFTTSNIRNTALAADGSQQGESPRDENKMMSSGEVALRIFRAVEKRKKLLVLTTQGKLTVWLNKFFPFWLDKMVYNHMAKEDNAPIR